MERPYLPFICVVRRLIPNAFASAGVPPLKSFAPAPLLVFFSTKSKRQREHPCLKYIHRNPTRPKWHLLETAEGYKWSSAAYYKHGDCSWPFLTHFGMVMIGQLRLNRKVVIYLGLMVLQARMCSLPCALGGKNTPRAARGRTL